MRFFQVVVFLSMLVLVALLACAGPSAPEDGVFWGMRVANEKVALASTEMASSALGYVPPITMWHMDWEGSFPAEKAEKLLLRGSVPYIWWEPWFFGEGDSVELGEIAEGTWDDYIDSWVSDIKKFSYPVLISFAPNFVLDGYTDAFWTDGKRSILYRDAYQYVVDFFVEAGALNVIWVWPIKASDITQKVMDVYPGDDYVDMIGIGLDKGMDLSSLKRASQYFKTNLPEIALLIHHLPLSVAPKFQEFSAFLEQEKSSIRAFIWDGDPTGIPELQEPLKKPFFRLSTDDIQQISKRLEP